MPRSPIPQGPCQFLELPSKIRDQIYGYLLYTEDPIDISDCSPAPGLHPSILRTRRSIYQEASELLYSRNCFHFKVNDRQGMNLPPETFFQKRLSVEKIRRMRKIHVELTVGPFDNPVPIIVLAFGWGVNPQYRLVQPSAFFLFPSLRRFVTYYHSKGLVHKIGMARVPNDTPAQFLARIRQVCKGSRWESILSFATSSTKIFFQDQLALKTYDAFVKAREYDMIYLCKLLKTIPNLEQLQINVSRPMSTDMPSKILRLVLSPFLQFRGLHHAQITGIEQADFKKKLESTIMRPKPTFNFFQLPGEIRNQVYRLVLVSSYDLDVQRANTCQNRINLISLSVLRTNRQIYHEARPILYAENAFMVQVNCWVRHNIWKENWANGPGIVLDNARFIRTLKIVIDSRHKHHVPAKTREWIYLEPNTTSSQWELWYPQSHHARVFEKDPLMRRKAQKHPPKTIQSDPVMVRFPLRKRTGASDHVSEGLVGTLDEFLALIDRRLEGVANMLPFMSNLEQLHLMFPSSSARWNEWGDSLSIQRLLLQPGLKKLNLYGYISPRLRIDYMRVLEAKNRANREPDGRFTW
ncbi:MAG: hypothetical protein M1837_002571 [Sclerophora amabilis]|nr:MAG: hypothetical protein M1837_002571 [Sclerophora amabilis]